MTQKEILINLIKQTDKDVVLDKIALHALIRSENQNDELIERGCTRLSSAISLLKEYQKQLKEIEEAEEKAALEAQLESSKKKAEAKDKLGLK